MEKATDEKIIAALLTAPTTREAADIAGVTPQTIYNKMQDDNFLTKFRNEKKELLSQTTTFLQANTAEAIKIMRDIAKDSETNAQTRLLAARALCDYSLKFTTQTDILDRLDKLEEAGEY